MIPLKRFIGVVLIGSITPATGNKLMEKFHNSNSFNFLNNLQFTVWNVINWIRGRFQEWTANGVRTFPTIGKVASTTLSKAQHPSWVVPLKTNEINFPRECVNLNSWMAQMGKTYQRMGSAWPRKIRTTNSLENFACVTLTSAIHQQVIWRNIASQLPSDLATPNFRFAVTQHGFDLAFHGSADIRSASTILI